MSRPNVDDDGLDDDGLDPGHGLPEEVMALVIAEADAEDRPPPDLPPPTLPPPDVPPPDVSVPDFPLPDFPLPDFPLPDFPEPLPEIPEPVAEDPSVPFPPAFEEPRRHEIRALSDRGPMPGIPRIGVVHSAESVIRAGIARGIAKHWFAARKANGRPATKTSAHVIVDPDNVVVMLPDDTIAAHCGNGNRRSKGYEQAGFARFTREQWTTPDGMRQMRVLANEIAADAVQYGWPLRWATTEQIREAHRGGPPAGLATHDDMRRAVGGTDHTDPGDSYPRALLLQLVVTRVRELTGGPTRTAFIATAERDEDDMTPEQARQLQDVQRRLGAVEQQLGEVHGMLIALGAARRPDRADHDARRVDLGDLLTGIERATERLEKVVRATGPA